MAEANPYEPSSSTTTPEQEASDRSRLRKIAAAHRQVNFAVLLNLCMVLTKAALEILDEGAVWAHVLHGVIGMAVFNFGIVSVYNLAKKLRGKTVAVVHAMSLFVPFLGPILFMTNSQEATKLLQAKGIKVGLLGASPESI